MQVIYECHAYACEWQDIEKIVGGKDTPMLVNDPDWLSENDTYLGTVVLTATYGTKEELASKQIERLQALLQAARAEAQARENAILERITKLQALTYEAA